MARRSKSDVPRYRDPELDVDVRVADLLERLSPDEKLQQLVGCQPAQLCVDGQFHLETAQRVLANGIGHVSRIGGAASHSPVQTAEIANAIQKVLIEDTAHGIPAIVHEEASAGYCARDASAFPHAIGQAATFEPRLVRRLAAATATQMRAVGVRQALAPVLDVARDPRWGRLEETYGEDPYLCGRMGIAFVRGLQGDELTDGVAATAKHFLGYGLPEGGMNHAPVQIGPRQLREVYAEPFAAAIREARLACVMHSHSSIDGVPCAGAPSVLRDLLREELKFDGVVVAGYYGVALLAQHHHVAADKVQAAVLALRAGLDIELPAKDCFGSEFAELIASDAPLQALVNEAVARSLRLKFELGLFEAPYVDVGQVAVTFGTPDQQALALEVAEASMVLLENDGLLPLQGEPSIALLGPAADDGRLLLGDYHYPAQAEFADAARESNAEPLVVAVETPRAALQQQYAVQYARGCGLQPGQDNEIASIKEAVSLARTCDLAVICVGGRSGLLPDDSSGEFRDATDLRLTGNQEALIDRVLATGKPVVVAVFGGRAFDLSAFSTRVSGLLHCWLPGEAGGTALARILGGAVSPSARLPVSLLRNAGQVPSYYGHRSGGGRSVVYGSYTDASNKPLYPFGHGLSYSTFSYSPMEGPTAVDVFGVIVLSVVIENTGNCAAAEVVQLYLRDTLADVARPAKSLAGFARVALAPGECKRVQFQLDTSQAAYFNQAMDFVVEPGEIKLFVGSSSERLHGELSVMLEGEMRYLQQHQIISTRVAITPANTD